MSVCVNHPNREAASRCSSCHKPICDSCIVKSDGSDFCSNACQQNAARFNKNFKPDTGGGFFQRMKNTLIGIVGLAVVGAIAVFVCAKVLKIAFFVKLLNSFGL